MTTHELSTPTPLITREEEAALYQYLRNQTDGDSFRYEMIARKFQQVADGSTCKWAVQITTDWLAFMRAEQAARLAASEQPNRHEAPFAAVKRGQVGSTNYQAFLDTLEQHELDAIENNVPYFIWFSERQRDRQREKSTLSGAEYLRQWADAHLSERVKALRQAS